MSESGWDETLLSLISAKKRSQLNTSLISVALSNRVHFLSFPPSTLNIWITYLERQIEWVNLDEMRRCFLWFLQRSRSKYISVALSNQKHFLSFQPLTQNIWVTYTKGDKSGEWIWMRWDIVFIDFRGEVVPKLNICLISVALYLDSLITLLSLKLKSVHEKNSDLPIFSWVIFQ